MARLTAIWQGPVRMPVPKGVDPALGIQLLKRQLVLQALNLRGKKAPAPQAALNSQYISNEKIPQPPARTVSAEKA